MNTESDADFKLVSFDVKRASGMIGPVYSYKLKVQNDSESTMQFMGSVIFLDNEEFEVRRGVITPFSVPAKQSLNVTGTETIIDEGEAKRIADVTAQIFPI